jgi:ABC-type glutathione transport system ATPase component
VRLEITGLNVRFGARAVVNVDHLGVDDAEIVGLAGESGSGKSMTTLAVLGLANTVGATMAGSIKLDGRELVGLPEKVLIGLRGSRIAAIFQSPSMAFNPVFRVGDVALRALRRHGASGSEATDRVDQAMRGVLLSPDLLRRYPSQLSGGQLQRVAIALAVALRAEVLLADEPTSALDVTVQAEVLELLRELRSRDGMSVLFISHDLAVIAELCDRVAVMQSGSIVEQGPTDQIMSAPEHPYTADLLRSVPAIEQCLPGGTTPPNPPGKG